MPFTINTRNDIRGDYQMTLEISGAGNEYENILDCLERTEERFGNKTAVSDTKLSLTWHELAATARKIGSSLAGLVPAGKPVPVLMEKSAFTLAVMFGAVYAGCFYVPVNPDNPGERLRKIFETLEAEQVVVDDDGKKLLEKTGLLAEGKLKPVPAEELLGNGPDLQKLSDRRSGSRGSDPLYGIFTSGSTGNPKAVIVSHKAVLQFIGHFTECFHITEEDVIGNQAPFDFDVSVKDIYSAVMTGASLALIPKEYFSTPPRLLDDLCARKVTTLIWAVSALTLVSSLKGLAYRVPGYVNKVMFSGESMPPGQLRMWQDALPQAEFVNLYGPTEITCNCTFYRVKRRYEDKEKIPAGRAFPGRTVFLLGEDGRRIDAPGQQGEICVAGESLAEGYYRNPRQTAQRFVMYRVNGKEETRIYKTGDMGSFNEDGELVFAGRKDFQIKHMGHRIELEEIESAMNSVERIQRSCCVFDQERNRITGFYMGDAEPSEVRAALKKKIPLYMVPPRLIRMDVMPLNKNGKTDREYLKKAAQEKGGRKV